MQFDYDTPAEGSSAGGFDLSILAALSGENQQPPPGQDSDTQAAKAAATATEPSTTDASTTANGGEQNHEQSAAMGAAAVQQTGVAVAGDVSSSITIPDAGFACSLDQDKAGPSAQQGNIVQRSCRCYVTRLYASILCWLLALFMDHLLMLLFVCCSRHHGGTGNLRCTC